MDTPTRLTIPLESGALRARGPASLPALSPLFGVTSYLLLGQSSPCLADLLPSPASWPPPTPAATAKVTDDLLIASSDRHLWALITLSRGPLGWLWLQLLVPSHALGSLGLAWAPLPASLHAVTGQKRCPGAADVRPVAASGDSQMRAAEGLGIQRLV